MGAQEGRPEGQDGGPEGPRRVQKGQDGAQKAQDGGPEGPRWASRRAHCFQVAHLKESPDLGRVFE